MSELTRRQFLSYSSALSLSLFQPNYSKATSNSNRLHGIIRELEGEVFVNKNIANEMTTIKSGDIVSVAYGGRLIFSIGEDTYLVKGGSSLEVESHNNATVSGLRLFTGGLLAAFGKRKTPTTIYTRTATIGIRGTGVYINSHPENLYFCTCYGTTDLHLGRHHTEHIQSTHHHALEISGNSENTMVMKATQVLDHTDEELRLIEQYSGRKPSFDL